MVLSGPRQLKPGRGRDETGRVSRRTPLRLLPVGLVAWLVFGLAWWRVFRMDAQVGTPVVAEVATCALLVLAVNIWWVTHNRRIYRRKGPRRGIPRRDRDYSRDSLGRPVVHLRPGSRPAEVALHLRPDGTKVYLPEAS